MTDMKVYLYKHNINSDYIFIDKHNIHYHYDAGRKIQSINVGYIEVKDCFFQSPADIEKALFKTENNIINALIGSDKQ
jgi:hypothetical protein